MAKKAVVTAVLWILWSGSAVVAAPDNGSFSSGLDGWTVSGDVVVEDGRALFGDTGGENYLFQGIALSPGDYTLEFDFQGDLSSIVPQEQPFAFIDSFFASLYFTDDIALFEPNTPSNSVLGLLDLEGSGVSVVQGSLGESALGNDWSHYTLEFTNTFGWAVPFFELVDLNFRLGDSEVRIDNVAIREDELVCVGECDAENPDLDEDGDGVSNCVEIEEETDPCDAGSFIPKLQPMACAGPNGFFQQVNIASVVNHLEEPLGVTVEYRDLLGTLKGRVQFALEALGKQDIIVNDLGLEEDSYGTVCVFTDAEELGAWSGGLVIYKPRFPENKVTREIPFGEELDFALFYPFENPQTGISNITLNTNAVGTNDSGTVANWIRISDAVVGDGEGIRGSIIYYNLEGRVLGRHKVELPDGGRFDYAAHEILGTAGVGQAEYVPQDSREEYYIESSRYFYEGIGAVSSNFWTAFTVPNLPLSGVDRAGAVSAKSGELSVVEVINGASDDVSTSLVVYDEQGAEVIRETPYLAGKGSYHKVVSDGILSAGAVGSAEVSGAREAINAITLVYVFDEETGLLDHAYAPAFIESSGATQITDFNSFLEQRNTLSLYNQKEETLVGEISVVDYMGTVVQREVVAVAPKATREVELRVPRNRYGTVRIDSGGRAGLVVRNDVERKGQYALSLPAR